MEKGKAEERRLPLKHNEPGRCGGCDDGGRCILLSISAAEITHWSKLRKVYFSLSFYVTVYHEDTETGTWRGVLKQRPQKSVAYTGSPCVSYTAQGCPCSGWTGPPRSINNR